MTESNRSLFAGVTVGVLAGVLVGVACEKNTPNNNPNTNTTTTSNTNTDTGTTHANHAPDAANTESHPPATMDSGTNAAPDAASAPSNAVLTVRITNVGNRPFNVFINEDTNEMLHTRKMFGRRRADSEGLSAEGELVKFFPVGRMPLCSSDAGAGYGGLGQPERRALNPNESLEYTWDGLLRQETLRPDRGVCLDVTRPQDGRYRFEFDQPYNWLNCNRPTFTLPLAPDAPRVLEIRCQPSGHRE